MILSEPINAQLSESQRKERCENNKKRLAELERDLDEIIRLPEREQIKHEKSDLVIIKNYINFVKDTVELGRAMRNEKDEYKRLEISRSINDRYQTYGHELVSNVDILEADPARISAKYNCGDCSGDINCLNKLYNIVANKIAREETSKQTRSEVLQRKAGLEKQIRFHRNNLIALKCDEQNGSVTSNDDSPNSESKSKRACNNSESQAFSQMIGSWKTYALKLTITGSCNNASGKMEWVEWCSSIDDENSKYLHYPGTFRGEMDGETLVLRWNIPAIGLHPEQKGTAYLHQENGTISVRGFGCGNGALNK